MIKITDELIKRMELCPYDDWDADVNRKECNVEVDGIDGDVREHFDLWSDEWPDSYTTSYAIIDPIAKEVIKLEIHIVDGCDGLNDKGETINIPKKYRRKIFDQLRTNSSDYLKDELDDWILEIEDEIKNQS